MEVQFFPGAWDGPINMSLSVLWKKLSRKGIPWWNILYSVPTGNKSRKEFHTNKYKEGVQFSTAIQENYDNAMKLSSFSHSGCVQLLCIPLDSAMPCHPIPIVWKNEWHKIDMGGYQWIRNAVDSRQHKKTNRFAQLQVMICYILNFAPQKIFYHHITSEL